MAEVTTAQGTSVPSSGPSPSLCPLPGVLFLLVFFSNVDLYERLPNTSCFLAGTLSALSKTLLSDMVASPILPIKPYGWCDCPGRTEQEATGTHPSCAPQLVAEGGFECGQSAFKVCAIDHDPADPLDPEGALRCLRVLLVRDAVSASSAWAFGPPLISPALCNRPH